MAVEMIPRTRCAVTGAEDIEPLHCFRDFPVFMGCTMHPQAQDLHVDMDWGISRSSGLVQLRKLVPLDVLYPESHGAGSVGDLWHQHHRAFAQFITRYAPDSVFEIGGGQWPSGKI